MIGRSTWRLILGYGGLAAVLLACFRLISLAPLGLSWGRELVAGAIAVVGVIVGLKLAQRHDARPPDRSPESGSEPPAGPPVVSPGGDAAALTPRERRVLDLLAQGLANKEIARELALSENTVKTHLANLYGKLGARRRTEALAAARKLGMIA